MRIRPRKITPSPRKFAQGTDVSILDTRIEIERILLRYGATGFMYAADDTQGVIGFKVNGRYYRFDLPIPSPDADQFRKTDSGRPRPREAAQKAYDDEVRRLWRSLTLYIKAVLEAADSGILELKDALVGQVVLPDGKLFGSYANKQIDEAIKVGGYPKLTFKP